jgi:outer membrane protein assembly factor BamB
LSALSIGADGTLYLPGGAGLYSISPSGSIKWVQSVNCYQSTTAISYDGSLYCGSPYYDFYSLHSTGSIKWSFETVYPILSSPTIDANGMIYFGCSDFNLYSFYPSGSLLWSYYMYSAVKSSPAIDSAGNIIVGTEGGSVYSINPDGLLVWLTITSSGQFDISSPAIDSNGNIYIGSISSDHSLYALTSNGSIKWLFVAQDVIYSSPSIGPDGSVVFSGYSDQNVYCLTQSGSLKWTFKMTSYSQYTSPVIGADGKIYISSNHLYALYPSGSLQWITLINQNPQNPVISSSGVLYTTAGSTVYSVGIVTSTLSPSIQSFKGLQTGAASPKYRGYTTNLVFLHDSNHSNNHDDNYDMYLM